MRYIGCHLSVSGGFCAAVRTAHSIGANTFAYFTRNPRGSQARKEDPADAAAAMALMQELGFGKRGVLIGTVVLSLLAFVVAQLGFKDLIGTVYPVLGYIGIIPITVIFVRAAILFVQKRKQKKTAPAKEEK